jgi:MarR family transcriptional regulator for hemolysin
MENPSLGLLLHDASRMVRKRFESRSAEFNLTSAQWRMLFLVCKAEDGAPQSRFADVLDIEPISVSRQLDRMEAQGWITRALDPQDRRIRRVRPTEKALAAFAHVKSHADAVYAEALEGLSPLARQALTDALALIIQNLTKAEDLGRKDSQ